MNETPGGNDVERSTDSSERYARWRTFDTAQQSGYRICCWLDRKTGRLLFQPDGLDPNLLAAPPALVYSYVG
ncbi:MAG TPA: hypothetical protein VMH26_04920 [Burkholderiales bacterium]|nr:hypothetical protein [Burkholderiales bacterium]